MKTLVALFLGWSLGGAVAGDTVGFLNVSVPPGFTLLANPLDHGSNTVAELINEGWEADGLVLYTLPARTPTSAMIDEARLPLEQWLRSFPEGATAASISLTRSNRNVLVNWEGSLFAAERVTGPFAAVTNQSRPLIVPEQGSSQFWIARGDGTHTLAARFIANILADGAWSDPDQVLPLGEGFVLYNPTNRPITITFTGSIRQGSLTNTIPAGISLRASIVPETGRLTTDLGLQLNPGDRVYLWNGQQFAEYTVNSDETWLPAEPRIEVGKSFFVSARQPVVWVRTFSVQQAAVAGVVLAK